MKCELCGHEDKAPENMSEDLVLMLDHLRLVHPEAYGDGPDRWPDGSVVLLDDTLTPDDFGAS